jgi:hypothetical protein
MAFPMADLLTSIPVQHVQLTLDLPEWHWLRRHHHRLARLPTIDEAQSALTTPGLFAWPLNFSNWGV